MLTSRLAKTFETSSLVDVNSGRDFQKEVCVPQEAGECAEGCQILNASVDGEWADG